MIKRNAEDHFAKTPTPHFPRSRFDMKINKRLQTQGHGRIYPFFARAVYPGDTWQMDMTVFCRADTSLRVPLDDIWLDVYWFFVPYRIIDKNFPKILGEGEPSDYDDVSYGFPTFGIASMDSGVYDINNLLPYLGYNQANYYVGEGDSVGKFGFSAPDSICPYPLAAYYKIYNDWFRDENLDPSIPYEDLYNDTDSTYYNSVLFDNLNCLKVNKLHDPFTSSVISPQKGPAQTILNANTAPVIISGNGSSVSANQTLTFTNGDALSSTDKTAEVRLLYQGTNKGTLAADLSQVNATINDLRMAWMIQSLYERRGRFGTRYISVIRGQWGIEVPDIFFTRPEYLGGNRVTLNNVPVLSTENSSQLGQMSGNSATLSNGGSWTKTFVDYGIIIGVSCTRVKHSYTQGVNSEIFDLKTQLDLYNPVFANSGMQPVKTRRIYNIGINDDSTFAYQEPYWYLRCDNDTFAGLFGVFSANSEIKNKWHYGDYYSQQPNFSASWLKEDYKNVARTMTGQLIAGAGDTTKEGHQFMFGYYYHPIVTRILPDHSVPVELLGRL